MLTDIVLLCFNQALIISSLQLENHMNQLCQIMCAYPIQTAQWVRSIHIDYLQFMLLAFFFPPSVCMAHYSFKVEALKQFTVL